MVFPWSLTLSLSDLPGCFVQLSRRRRMIGSFASHHGFCMGEILRSGPARKRCKGGGYVRAREALNCAFPLLLECLVAGEDGYGCKTWTRR